MNIMSRLLQEESGDDLLEYALLSAIVGIAGAVALALLPNVINTVYSAWNVAAQNAWQPADPIP